MKPYPNLTMVAMMSEEAVLQNNVPEVLAVEGEDDTGGSKA